MFKDKMGLTKIEKINDSSWWALWKINPGRVEIPHSDKNDPELSQIHHPKKLAEWSAGRKTLQAILEKWQLPYYGSWKDHFGKPYLRHYPFYISLANCYPYAAAIIHMNKPVGIDIEFPKEKLVSIKEKFLNEKEQAYSGSVPYELGYYWCAKECLYKIQGKKKISFKQHLYLPPFNVLEGVSEIKGGVYTENQSEVYSMQGQAYHDHEENFKNNASALSTPPLIIVYSV